MMTQIKTRTRILESSGEKNLKWKKEIINFEELLNDV